MNESRLTRSETDQMIAGVCGGIAAYLNVDSVFVRLAFVLLALASGIGLPIYIILWIVMPQEKTAAASDAVVMQENIKDLQAAVSTNANKIGKSATIGLIFILIGGYFLLTELGILSWASGALWPILIIGAGLFLLWRRSQN